jgi:hypothetical protein
MKYTAKQIWAQNLRIGDLVEDCSFQILLIVNYQDCYVPLYRGTLLMYFLDLFHLEVLYERLMIKLGFVRWVDKHLELKGEKHCSAMHCCDKP